MFLHPQFNATLQRGPCGTDPSSHPIFQQKLTTWAVSSRVRTGFCLSSMLFYLPPTGDSPKDSFISQTPSQMLIRVPANMLDATHHLP